VGQKENPVSERFRQTARQLANPTYQKRLSHRIPRANSAEIQRKRENSAVKSAQSLFSEHAASATPVDTPQLFPDNLEPNRLCANSLLFGMSQMAGSALTFTDANFQSDVLNHTGVALVDFWAPWCGPCVRLGPAIEALADDFAGIAKVGKLNVDENSKSTTAYGISSIPCMIIFKNGQPVQRMVGLMTKDAIAAALNAALKG
jgi:thioredoxin 1